MDTLTFPDWGNRGFLFLSKTDDNNTGPTLRRRVSSMQTMTNSQDSLNAVSKITTKAHAPLSTLALSSSPTTPLHKHVQRTHLHIVSTPLKTSRSQIGKTHHTQPQHHTTPKQHIIQQRPAPHPLAPLHHDNRHLQHHGEKPIPAEFSGNAAHDEFVREGGDQEGGESGEGAGEGVSARGVDVAAEEVVDGDVPFAGELQPVARVPPVGVELAVCETCGDIRKSEKERKGGGGKVDLWGEGTYV